MSARLIKDTTRVPVAVIQSLAVLVFLVFARPALADLCNSPNILMSDGSCYLVTVETTLDIAPLVDVDPNPFSEIYDSYSSGSPDIFVSGALPASTIEIINWTFNPRTALSQLKQSIEATIAQQLGVPVDNILRRSAHGQINSLLFIRIVSVINKSESQRDSFETQLYNEVQEAFQNRRLHISTTAANLYNSWRDNPCAFKIPVGDNPDAYLNQTGVESYCLASEFGNTLALAFTNTPAIASENFLFWASTMRTNDLMTYWAYRSRDYSSMAAEVFSKAYFDSHEAMAYHLAWGTLSEHPNFNFDDIYTDSASLDSGLQGIVQDFTASYFRDFFGTWVVGVIAQGFGGLAPDPHDIIILATALSIHSYLEIKTQIESREGVEAAMALSSQSLKTAVDTNKGRAELLLTLIELDMPSLIDARVTLPDQNNPVTSVFYSTQSPQSDLVQLKDWSTDFSSNDSYHSQFMFTDQGWLSRSTGLVIDINNPYYDSFTPNVRFVRPNGDFASAWLVKGENNTYRQFLITRYAQLLRENTTGYQKDSNPEIRVRVARRVNSDCPAKDTYPFNSNPVDYGYTCIIVEQGRYKASANTINDYANLGFQYRPALEWHEDFEFWGGRDTIIIAGRATKIKQLYADDSSYVTKFIVDDPISNGPLYNQVVHKVSPKVVSGTRTDRFAYKTYNATATAILDFSALPPEIAIAHPELVAEANAVMSTVNLGEVTAIDPTDGAVAVTSDAPAAFPLGSTTVTYTATDSAGNSTTATQTVIVVDNTTPQFSALPQQKVVEATANPMPVILDVPLATDIFALTVSSNVPLGGFPLGDTVVTWTATDASGNSVSVQQTVTITDTTPPVFTMIPADFTMEATGPLTLVNPGLATATDLFGATVSHDVPVTGLGIGAHVITWTAIDTNGNQTQVTQTVTVVDTTPPSIALEFPSIQVEASDVLSLVNLGTATALDLVDGSVAVTHDAPVTFPLGNTLVTYSAVDSRGNLATVTQSVTVVDTTSPEFTTLPLDIDRIAEGPNSSFNLGIVEASDIFAVTITNDAPATLPVGTTIVTWTATDTSGNTVTSTQTIKLSYAFSGFEKPLEANGVYKVNRVLPLRISLTYADGTIAESAVALLSVGMLQSGEDSSEPVIIDIEASADSGNRFLLRGGTFQYNLETRSLASGTYRLMVTLDDGNHYTIDIALKQ